MEVSPKYLLVRAFSGVVVEAAAEEPSGTGSDRSGKRPVKGSLEELF